MGREENYRKDKKRAMFGIKKKEQGALDNKHIQ